MTLTGEKAGMRGKKPLKIQAGYQELVFWLATIRDPCIIGLDLLTHWGACVDMVKATITGTMTLQPSRGKKNGPRDQRPNC